MYLKEKQYKIAMILLYPVQGPWDSSFSFHLWDGSISLWIRIQNDAIF